jgi:hypothetical protein
MGSFLSNNAYIIFETFGSKKDGYDFIVEKLSINNDGEIVPGEISKITPEQEIKIINLFDISTNVIFDMTKEIDIFCQSNIDNNIIYHIVIKKI